MNCFQRKTPRCKFGFSKFCALRPKWCVLAGSKMTQSVCVCNAHQNVVLPVDTMNLDLPYKEQQLHHASVWILSWHCNSERISWSGTQSTVGHYVSSNIDSLYNSLRRIIQRDFDWCYCWFNKTFLYRKAKNHQFLIQDSYHWSIEYCKLHNLVVYYLRPDISPQHDSLCFSSDDNNHYTSFYLYQVQTSICIKLYQVQTMLVHYLKDNHSHIIKN